ncbi:MAG: hypothetical protein FWD78_13280 [Treponema sp.]|nr:hypothetical protein [Treponema sp.]
MRDQISDSEILRLLPPVLRARGYYLYLDSGRRLCDFWQLGGAAILGHKPPSVVTELKNYAERGLFAPLPHHTEGRFLKALGKLFPAKNGLQYKFRIYSDKHSMFKALENAGFEANNIPDPAFPHDSNAESNSEKNNAIKKPVSIWRPFLGSANFESQIYLPVLPWSLSPPVLVLEDLVQDKSVQNDSVQNESVQEESPDKKLRPGDLVSPVILAGAARAVYDLIAAADNGQRPRFARVEKALAASGKFQKQGIYITPRPGAGVDWIDLWKHFLENGFLLPPDPAEPLILPGVLSPGEEAKLAELL